MHMKNTPYLKARKQGNKKRDNIFSNLQTNTFTITIVCPTLRVRDVTLNEVLLTHTCANNDERLKSTL